jgi:hypothetical protein
MKHLLLVAPIACATLVACTPMSDDTGAPEPASWWPWVCADGGPAPEAGCVSVPEDSGAEGDAGDAGSAGDTDASDAGTG